MKLRTLIPAIALAAAVAAPAGAQDRDRHRAKDEGQPQAEHARERQQPSRAEAPPRQAPAQPIDRARRQEQPRRQEAPPQPTARVQAPPPRTQAPLRQGEIAVPRRNGVVRNDDSRGNDARVFNNGRFENRGNDWRRWDNRRYESYVVGVHRYDAYVIQPVVVRVVSYQPYVYRPSFSIGVFYGDGGYYPYGYTPEYYFEPISGRAYGGVRITGAPRDAQVFADGYYVGIVDDFDGVFQHVNLPAGPHHIEIAWGGYQPIAFDVFVRPGETTTFRADGYFRY